MKISTKKILILSGIGLVGIVLGSTQTFQNEQITSRAYPTEPETEMVLPSRPAYGDCVWEDVVGAGIRLLGQRCTTEDGILYVAASETLPGFFLEEVTPNGPVALSRLIQLFSMTDGRIADVLPTLAKTEDWDETEGCQFVRNTEYSTDTITRYDLTPTGTALELYRTQAAIEPVTSTCGGYGMGNSGIRYFEVHASQPTIAIFLEIGQEAPLFDEQSIRFVMTTE